MSILLFSLSLQQHAKPLLYCGSLAEVHAQQI